MPLRSVRATYAAVAIVFVTMAAASRLLTLPYLAGYYTSPIILEFLFGGALALAWSTWPGQEDTAKGFPALGWAAILLGFGLVLAQDALHLPIQRKEDWRFLAYGVPATMIVGGALLLERAGQRRDGGFAQLLGAASYALYLFHPLIEQVVVQYGTRFGHVVGPAAPWVIGIAAVAASLGGAIVIYIVIEKRILKAGRALTGRATSSRTDITGTKQIFAE
jgi:peptidoglycan/LPS O-acetylase OafA/YrhL